jgi:hypothetical protein
MSFFSRRLARRERAGAKRHVRVCASERRPVGGSSETVSAAEGRRDPGAVRDDRGAAVRRKSRQPASDSGASDVASAFFGRLRRFVGHGTRKGRADAARNRRTAVVLLFLLVWMVFVTIAQQLASLEHIPAPTSDAIGSVK